MFGIKKRLRNHNNRDVWNKEEEMGVWGRFN
jgi:hypothetical protein